MKTPKKQLSEPVVCDKDKLNFALDRIYALQKKIVRLKRLGIITGHPNDKQEIVITQPQNRSHHLLKALMGNKDND